jgi:hypothetical protein
MAQDYPPCKTTRVVWQCGCLIETVTEYCSYAQAARMFRSVGALETDPKLLNAEGKCAEGPDHEQHHGERQVAKRRRCPDCQRKFHKEYKRAYAKKKSEEDKMGRRDGKSANAGGSTAK